MRNTFYKTRKKLPGLEDHEDSEELEVVAMNSMNQSTNQPKKKSLTFK